MQQLRSVILITQWEYAYSLYSTFKKKKKLIIEGRGYIWDLVGLVFMISDSFLHCIIPQFFSPSLINYPLINWIKIFIRYSLIYSTVILKEIYCYLSLSINIYKILKNFLIQNHIKYFLYNTILKIIN